MILIDEKTIEEMEQQHPGLKEQIYRFENAQLPECAHCRSTNTADVQVGIVGRTIYIAGATTKFRLIPNLPKPGKYYCNTCKKYFG
jgi:hypothetical protein